MTPSMIAFCSEISLPSIGLTTDLISNRCLSSPSAADICSVRAVCDSAPNPNILPGSTDPAAAPSSVVSSIISAPSSVKDVFPSRVRFRPPYFPPRPSLESYLVPVPCDPDPPDSYVVPVPWEPDPPPPNSYLVPVPWDPDPSDPSVVSVSPYPSPLDWSRPSRGRVVFQNLQNDKRRCDNFYEK